MPNRSRNLGFLRVAGIGLLLLFWGATPALRAGIPHPNWRVPRGRAAQLRPALERPGFACGGERPQQRARSVGRRGLDHRLTVDRGAPGGSGEETL